MSRGTGFLPIPFLNYIVKGLKKNINSGGAALATKIDTHISDWLDDIVSLPNLLNPLKCPANLLSELDFYLNAGLIPYDSDITKRYKISHAVQGHKQRGSWENDAKNKIDSITGLDSAIYRRKSGSDWILVTDGDLPTNNYWSAFGSDGVDDELGVDLIGAGDEVEISGNIYINCHDGITVSTLTSTQIDQIVYELRFDIAPAYMKIFLGYLDSAGAFIQYAGGII